MIICSQCGYRDPAVGVTKCPNCDHEHRQGERFNPAHGSSFVPPVPWRDETTKHFGQRCFEALRRWMESHPGHAHPR
jgi:hypothetical protein